MSRLDPIEAQRVSGILEETLEKLGFLGSIAPDVLAHRDELSQFVGDEISRIIQEQRELEQRYEGLIAARSKLKGLANKTRFKENQREIQDVSRALRESTKKLCRNLKENPNIGGNLQKIQDEREDLEKLLRTTLSELRDGSYATLAQQVEDDKREQENLERIIQREKEASEAVRQLSDELETEQREHARELDERKKRIAALKEQLYEQRAKTSVRAKFERKQAVAKTTSTLRGYKLSEKEMEEEIARLRREKEVEKAAFDETMEFLEAEQKRLGELVTDWEERVQEETEAKEEELKEATEAREKDLARLRELQERHERDKAEEAARKAEEERKAELRKLNIQEEAKRNTAARRIQNGFKLYRSVKAQKAAENPKARGKGKGKKGKK